MPWKKQRESVLSRDDGWRPDPALTTREKIWAIIEHYSVEGEARIGPTFIAHLIGASLDSIDNMMGRMSAKGEIERVSQGDVNTSPVWKALARPVLLVTVIWTDAMDEILTSMWAVRKTSRRIATALGISKYIVARRRHHLGLKKIASTRKKSQPRLVTPPPPGIVPVETVQAPAEWPTEPESIDLDAALTWARRNGVLDDADGEPPGILTINAARVRYGLTPWIIRRRTSPMGALPHPGNKRQMTAEQAKGRLSKVQTRQKDQELPEPRFWRAVIKRGDEECWSCLNAGYIYVGKQKITMKRYSWRLLYGDDPDPNNLRVPFRVTCGNHDCVNPRHLKMIARMAEAAD